MRKALVSLLCLGLVTALLAGDAHALFGAKKKKKQDAEKPEPDGKDGDTSAKQVTRRVVRLPRDLPLEFVWSIPFERRIDRRRLYVYEDIILLLTSNHWLYQVRKRDGVVQWVMELRKDLDQGFPPVVTKVGVYVVMNNVIVFIDKDRGEIVWKLEPKFAMSATPLIAEPNIYVPSWDGRFHSLSIRSKERIFVRGKSREDSLIDRKYWLSKNWHRSTKGHIVQPARLRDNILYFGSEDNFFYAITREGRERYRFQTQGKIKAACTTKPSRVYVGSDDFNLYALNRLTGDKEWHFPTGSDVLETPYVDLQAGVVVVPSFRNGMYGVDERTGAQLWHIEAGVQVVAVGPELFYIGLTKRMLAAVEKKSGRVKWVSLLENYVRYIPAPNDYTRRDQPMRAYFLTKGNVLLCMKEREADSGPWTAGAGLRARGEN